MSPTVDRRTGLRLRRSGSPTIARETRVRNTFASVKIYLVGFFFGYGIGMFLFNDALNTFYLRLYGARHMVNDHSESERGNPLPPHRLLFPISSKGSFICIIPQTGYYIPRPLLHQSWSTSWIFGYILLKRCRIFISTNCFPRPKVGQTIFQGQRNEQGTNYSILLSRNRRERQVHAMDLAFFSINKL